MRLSSRTPSRPRRFSDEASSSLSRSSSRCHAVLRCLTNRSRGTIKHIQASWKSCKSCYSVSPMSLVECVPNFSEGRRPEIVRQIADSITAIESACVLDTHIDPDHNRSVITFVAPPETVVEAAVNAVRRASELIDMRTHQGEHPRLGATDVLPFVPVQGVTMDDCVRL